MSLFRLTFRLITPKNCSLKFNSILLIKQNDYELFTKKRSFTSKYNVANRENNLINNNLQQHLLRTYGTQEKNMNDERLVANELTKNLTIISNGKLNVSLDSKTMMLKEPIDGPLVIMFSWLLAKKKHLFKYAKIYTDQGINVLTIEITPWQVLWPTKGSQLVAAEVLKFLENNVQFTPLMIHGFSVGGYLWGEMMVIMARDLPRYETLLGNIYSQTWDSAVDITETSIGIPRAIFPKNKTLQNALRNYIVYHMNKFHDVSTVHYLRSCQLFHYTLLKAPALFLVSNSDPIGSAVSNKNVRDDMENAGIKTTFQCWEKSSHVGHYQRYPDEYLTIILRHLEDANIHERIAAKTRAKL